MSALPMITSAWAWGFGVLLRWLGLPGAVAVRAVEIGPWVSFGLPYVTTGATWPGAETWLLTCAVSAAVLVLTLVLPPRYVPLAYFLRALAIIQGTALVYFAVSRGPFPYELPAYMLGLLSAGLVFLLLIPVLLGFTYYVFDIALSRKILLTVAILGHLVVFLPLQSALHVCLIHRCSLLLMPILFFVFGILVDLFVFVAFYGWGMSWAGRRDAAP